MCIYHENSPFVKYIHILSWKNVCAIFLTGRFLTIYQYLIDIFCAILKNEIEEFGRGLLWKKI